MSEHMDPEFHIRRAVASDRARLAKLVRAYIDFYEEPQPDEERLDTLLAVLAERPEVGVQFVMDAGDPAASRRVTEALFAMKRIDIEALRRAKAGD